MMSEQWPVKTLGEVVETLRNGVNCKQNKSGIGAPISRIETIAQAEINYEKVGFSEISDEKKEKYGLKKNDILFSHINSPIHVGKTAIVKSNRELIHGVNLLLIRPNDEILPHFMNYYLIFLFKSKYWLRVCKKSVNQASVNQKDIKKVPIVVPSLEEQQRIVTILDDAFENIEENKNHIVQKKKGVEELLQSLLKSLMMSEQWTESTLEDVSIKITDGSHNPPKGVDFSDYRMLSSRNIFNDKINFDKIRYLTKDGYEKENRRTNIAAGDVLLTIVGTIGRVAVVEEDILPFTLQRSVAVIKPDLSKIDSRYLMYCLMSMSNDFNSQSRGAAQKGIYLKQLRSFTIKYPDLEEQQQIVIILDKAFNNFNQIEHSYSQEIASYEELKQSILQEAFNGNLAREIAA